MMEAPKEIKKVGNTGLRITWHDGSEDLIPSKVLREHCPSAVSLAKRGDQSHEKPLSGKSSLLNVVEASADEELDLQKIWGVGNYAIGIQWGDGHNTGIYTFPFLKELATKH